MSDDFNRHQCGKKLCLFRVDDPMSRSIGYECSISGQQWFISVVDLARTLKKSPSITQILMEMINAQHYCIAEHDKNKPYGPLEITVSRRMMRE